MTQAWKRFALASPSFGSYFVLKFAGVRVSRVCCCSGMVLVRLVGTFSVICYRVPAGDTVGASGTRGALHVLLLDVVVFDYVYALGASRSGSYYYHPEVVVAACVPVGDTGAMRLAAAAAAAAAAVVAACVPERGTEEKGLVLLTPPTHGQSGTFTLLLTHTYRC